MHAQQALDWRIVLRQRELSKEQQIEVIKSNPFAILFINNPAKEVIELAVKANSLVKVLINPLHSSKIKK